MINKGKGLRPLSVYILVEDTQNIDKDTTTKMRKQMRNEK